MYNDLKVRAVFMFAPRMGLLVLNRKWLHVSFFPPKAFSPSPAMLWFTLPTKSWLAIVSFLCLKALALSPDFKLFNGDTRKAHNLPLKLIWQLLHPWRAYFQLEGKSGASSCSAKLQANVSLGVSSVCLIKYTPNPLPIPLKVKHVYIYIIFHFSLWKFRAAKH